MDASALASLASGVIFCPSNLSTVVDAQSTAVVVQSAGAGAGAQ